MDDTLRKGCRVRLFGLTTSVLNGAEGCIIGPIDQESGRHPVKLLKPTEAVTAFPGGVKVKPANLEKVQLGTSSSSVQSGSIASPSSSAPAAPTRSRGGGSKQRAGGQREPAFMDPAAWAAGMSAKEREEWLVDCYRMRVDDDYAWGGGNLHGLYDPDHDNATIVADFLVFCKLAVRNGVVPKAGWKWDSYLAKARELLPYAFEKSDAQDKYGRENVFAAAMGGRSLRYTAEVVYGTSCMAGASGGDEGPQREVEEQVLAAPLDQLFVEKPDLFEDVGGVALWERLLAGLG